MKNEEQSRSLFGISLSDRPTWQQFLICTSGFFFGYLVNGVCEEYVYNRLQFSFGWYFTFIQGFVYLFLIYLQGFTTKHIVNPMRTYVKLSAVLMGSHGLTKGSLAYLNYPAQIMFKSTKVLPVMIMGAFIPGLRRKYPVHEYISAFLLVLGLILFTLADAQMSPNFSMIGILMITGALIMDAFLDGDAFLLDGCWITVLVCSNGPNRRAIPCLDCVLASKSNPLFCPVLHPYVYGVLVFEAMATFIGQVSVLSLIALFGAATTALITTARKGVTLLLSYLIFTKPLTEQHGSGLLLIAMGIVLKMVPMDSKPPSKIPARPAARNAGGEGGREEEEERKSLV
ncbi:hypothetical protein DY000_02027107 [Brassica cretica]|uniref:Uncharacterized protein n=1 Tax=Brassica cretica TaxID=69181 RepID=A0ABQ7E7M0_BRACR|nr:hypothetical protein DY000_02027107 [Brassica cretica]